MVGPTNTAHPASREASSFRARYAKLRIHMTRIDDEDTDDQWDNVEPLDLYEYCHYVNVGSSMDTVMNSIATASGSPQLPIKLSEVLA